MDLWASVAANGWRSEAEGIGDFVLALGQISARAGGTHCFFAELDGRAVATAALSMDGRVALLAGRNAQTPMP